MNINWLLSGACQMYLVEGELEFDRDLMIQEFAFLEECLVKKGVKIDPAKKGKVAVKLFETLKRSGVAVGNLKMIGNEAMELEELV